MYIYVYNYKRICVYMYRKMDHTCMQPIDIFYMPMHVYIYICIGIHAHRGDAWSLRLIRGDAASSSGRIDDAA